MLTEHKRRDGVRGPAPIPLPPAPSDAFMSPAAWDILWALLDGLLPAIGPESSASEDSHGSQLVLSDEQFQRAVEGAMGTISGPPRPADVAAFLAQRSIDDPEFKDDCLRLLAINPANKLLGQLFGFMNTRLGSLILTGCWEPLYKQPVHVRESVLKSWTQSRFRILKGLAASIAALGHKAMGMTNPMYGTIVGYPDAPADWTPVEGYPFKFIQLDPGEGVHEIVTDVVIVGSGPGGAVCARNLAEAGNKVLVVERGYHFPTSQLPLTPRTGSQYQQFMNGVFASEDRSIALMMANTWGGGGTINWSVSLRLQDYVRKDWARSRGGLPFFTSSDFDECMDRVMDFIGAQQDLVRHNSANQVMLDGTAKLGWHGAPVPRNTGDAEHFCGHCSGGCPSGEKQGPANSWLPAAADAGAEFMEGFSVDKVLFEEPAGQGQEGAAKAIGVEGFWTSRGTNGALDTPMSARSRRRVRIKAKKVIIAAGTIGSPTVLLKSGLANPNIGRGLHLHPTIPVMAFYRKETRPWEGGIISTYCAEFKDLDGKGHGTILEPCGSNTMQRWESGLDTKLAALRYNHAAAIVSLSRDRDSGRVFLDAATGTPRFEYTPSKFDADSVIKGLIATAKIYYATGASEIRSVFSSLPAFRPDATVQEKLAPGQDPELMDGEFGAWLAQMRALSAADHLNAAHFSAHQMGTCAMSGDAKQGVVDGKGRVWDTENLYVADSSVFPSASGVNPMVTIMSLADWISRGIVKELSTRG